MKKLILLLAMFPFMVQAETAHNILDKTVKQLNKHLPLKVDDETRLDSVTGENNTLLYSYTLLNYLKAELDVDVLHSNIAPVVTQGACQQESMQVLFDSGVNVHYQYKGKEGETLILIKVAPADCKNK